VTPAEQAELDVARKFLAAMGWQSALDGGAFFPTLRQCVNEMLHGFIERWHFTTVSLRQRLAKAEERQAEILHRLEQIEAGLRLVLDQLGFVGPDAAGVGG
jgi:hypothetical protein